MQVFMYFFDYFHSKQLDSENTMIQIFIIYVVLLALRWVLGAWLVISLSLSPQNLQYPVYSDFLRNNNMVR